MPEATKFHQGGIEFQKINDHLLNAGAVHSASELQGYLCGLLCGGKKLAGSAWVSHAWEFLDLETIGIELDLDAGKSSHEHVAVDDDKDDLTDDLGGNALTKNLLEDLHKITRVQLADDNYSFTPLLPEDSSSLARRTEELGAWCQGFLHGVGASGMKGDKALSPEAAEAIRDLAEISQVDADFGETASQDLEENEVHLVELIEYVRAAVLTFRGDSLSPELASKLSAQPTGKPGNVVEGSFGSGGSTLH